MEYRIALIPGDGIGKEVIPEGVRVLEALAAAYGFTTKFTAFPYSCGHYIQHGEMMPADGLERLKVYDAILLGAVGDPKVPDHVSLWGLLLPIRRGFDQYVNLRPVRLLPGIECPLAGRRPDEIDFVVVRENTEGEYSEIGGRLFAGTDLEVVVQESVFTRRGVDRVIDFAFQLAQSRPDQHLTSATKSNGIMHTMPFWDERFEIIGRTYPDIRQDKFHIQTGSTWWSAATSSAIFYLIWGRQWPAAWASPLQPISISTENTPPCSSRFTVRLPTLPAKELQIPSQRSGRCR